MPDVTWATSFTRPQTGRLRSVKFKSRTRSEAELSLNPDSPLSQLCDLRPQGATVSSSVKRGRHSVYVSQYFCRLGEILYLEKWPPKGTELEKVASGSMLEGISFYRKLVVFIISLCSISFLNYEHVFLC